MLTRSASKFRFRLQHVADVGVALVLLIAFNLVAAQGSKELVRERLSEEKRILFLAGVHPVTYWITALIWDFLVSEEIRQFSNHQKRIRISSSVVPGVRMLHRFGRLRLRDLWPLRVRRQGQFARHLFTLVPVRVSFAIDRRTIAPFPSLSRLRSIRILFV